MSHSREEPCSEASFSAEDWMQMAEILSPGKSFCVLLR